MDYVNYPSQKELEKEAMDAGCYIKLDAIINFKQPLEMRVLKWNLENGGTCEIVHTDRRKAMNIQFITPHFTPWDEIFELVPRGQEEESTATFMGIKREIPEDDHGARRWRLRFDWRVSDVDYLVSPDLN
jgi:hypothetical protein